SAAVQGEHDRGEVGPCRGPGCHVAHRAPLQDRAGGGGEAGAHPFVRSAMGGGAGGDRRDAPPGGRASISPVHRAWQRTLASTPWVHSASAPHTAPETTAPARMGRVPLPAFATT